MNSKLTHEKKQNIVCCLGLVRAFSKKSSFSRVWCFTIGAVTFIFSPNFEKNVVKNIQYLNPKFPTRNDTVNNNDGDKMFPTSTNKIGNNH